MCNPALVYLGIAAAGTAVSVAGSYRQGKAAEKMYDYQSGMAQRSAEQTREAGSVAAKQHRVKAAQAAGAQRAAMGGAGVDVNTGSLLAAQEDTARMGEMDALTIRQNYQRQAWAKAADAGMYTAAGAEARKTALWGMAGSLLTGASKVSSGYSSLSNQQPAAGQNTRAMYSDYYTRRKRPDWNYGR